MAEPHRGFVLFVDDDLDTREIAEMVLLNAGFRCRAVATADEALAAAAVLRSDVVVVDLGLRYAMSGGDLARRLATLPDPPPLVFQTGRPVEDLPGDLPRASYLHKPYLPEDLVEVVLRAAGQGDPQVLTRCHVLIVNDHADTLALARQLLEHAGALVSEAESPEQAFEIVSSATAAVHVVVTNLAFKGASRSGGWLLKRMQATPALADIPIVAMTSHEDLEPELTQLGFAAVIRKPFEAPGFAAVVLNAARRRPDRQ